MFQDLHGFFYYELSPDNAYLLSKDFENGVVENKNARILYDKDGNVAMMYVFADENSVVIAKNKDAVHEMIVRLAQSKVKK